MPRTERDRERGEVERGESELNDLASRLQANHVSQKALWGLGLGLHSLINRTHTLGGGYESRLGDSLKMAATIHDGTKDNDEPLHFLYEHLFETPCSVKGERVCH